jgi:hypothetical protein
MLVHFNIIIVKDSIKNDPVIMKWYVFLKILNFRKSSLLLTATDQREPVVGKVPSDLPIMSSSNVVA